MNIQNFAPAPIIPEKEVHDTTVVVAMSGGVDSSVTATLLHALGYKVIGLTMRLYGDDNPTRKGACCAGIDINDAQDVAIKMGFKHYVLDYRDTFQRDVIDKFIESYAHGETPIPCITCNQTVKFRDLIQTAKALGADALATGHYVRRVAYNGHNYLCKAFDTSKDQSYFLFTTTGEQLAFLRFPLGEFKKSDIRNLATYFALNVADKPDSQDICFVKDKYTDFINKIKPSIMKTGNILDINGKILGQHAGIGRFTVGQRRGIGISHSDPLYIISINAVDNTVTVGPLSALRRNKVYIRECNWINQAALLGTEFGAHARLRSSHIGGNAMVKCHSDGSAEVTMLSGHHTVSPGQACVIYDGDRLMGGGWIYQPLQ